MTTGRRPRVAAPTGVAVACCLLVAVGTPVGWALTRPPEQAGQDLAAALTAPQGSGSAAAPAASAATAPPSSAGVPSAVPRVVTRDARPTAPSRVVPPVRLEVPALGLAAPVDPVGVDPRGRMAIPADVSRVGWYRFGATPGAQEGTAVVAGHVDSFEGLGVMAALSRLEAGARVELTGDDGQLTRYRVVSRDVVAKGRLPVDDIFRRSGPPRLVLITCGGPFLEETGHYRDNVVVVAVPDR